MTILLYIDNNNINLKLNSISLCSYLCFIRKFFLKFSQSFLRRSVSGKGKLLTKKYLLHSVQFFDNEGLSENK